ncbi:ATP-dependent DNA helicase RecG [Arachnia rubra]|uniref:ATP-dependent DNA helicase RecG n=1 Tax=Arachnia rubra TaxID=1547448 RepID=A0ABX7Y2I0_9ACTN|nr:ATP-dependent DNA helicase RecG [Arachnia rubra]MBB1577038.1 ATP-dependent DNA helicase RecG [Propionibacterium sp.]MDO4644590.1 ATP-dependent DNA helicase RecG [Propionibacteriaceae bacterium]QUC07077.1 ATP-dependent DNA helicase RecG [Arachnia rubra]BCR81324.1 ATP-dependent DNA helicase RecG [Arachnia rubra]
MSRFRTPIHRELSRRLRDVVGADSAAEMARLGLVTLGDLLRHVPRRYLAGTEMSDFRALHPGEDVAVVAKVVATTIVDGRTTRVETVLTDGHGELRAAFFVPQKRPRYANYWAGQLAPGARGIFVGKVGEFRGQLQLTHPDYVIIDEFGAITGRKADARAAMVKVIQRARLVGLYPATSKLVTWKIADAIALALPQVLPLGDTLPGWVVERAGVLAFPDALREVHEPVTELDAKRGIARLKFDEAFGMQLAMARRRAVLAERTTTPRPRRIDGILAAFDTSLPYQLTAGQQRVGETLFAELATERPMHRLLQGEVGSGKTLVALRAMLAVVDAGGQAALLAPTEVLARQHYASITALLGELGAAGMLEAHPQATQVAFLTGSLTAAGRRSARAAVASGEAGLVIGTHALLSEGVEFADLGLVVVDEQHRFGVEQRAALAAKSERQPHTLVMTATPIPRSVAMTVFGDLETIELRDRPAGRAEVKTVFVDTARNPHWVDRAWERIREEVTEGRQAFVVCPAISGNKTEGELEAGAGLSAVMEVAPMLAEGPLKGLRVGMVHGRQAAAERDQAMQAFTAGELDVLVATTVIEVGVDIPNASVMVILDADRFGIAQLHQLRGRIGRGTHPGLCLLLAAPTPEALGSVERLNALVASTDGFDLAERDLELRREGDVLGAAQSGASSLKLLRVLGDREVIEQAKELAAEILADSRAAQDPLLADLIDQAEQAAAGEWLEKG